MFKEQSQSSILIIWEIICKIKQNKSNKNRLESGQYKQWIRKCQTTENETDRLTESKRQQQQVAAQNEM